MAPRRFYRFDGETPVPITKQELNDWIVRAREGAAMFRAFADRGDLARMTDWANEAAGAAAELQNIAEATRLVWEGEGSP